MIRYLIFIAASTLLLSSTGVAQAEPTHLSKRTKQEVVAQWQHDRFGIFIHWGPSSVLELGAGSWNRADNVSQYTSGSAVGNKTANSVPEEIKSGDYLKYKGQGTAPQIVYDNLHHVFNPKGFDAKEWARLFKAAGAGYIVFTTKHHDGFCNFDTQTQDYDIMNTPFKRDICKELAIACRAERVRVFWYYSPVDWWHPDWRANADTAYEEKAFLPQMEELLTNYGPIDGIWWDGGQITEKYAKKVHELIQKHQPWALTNGRLGGGFGGDFETPEQKLGEFNIDSRWESCITMTGASWFWNGGKEYKSSNTCLKTLIACAVGDGNLLLDVGPRGDGRIDERAAEIYRSMGAWLKQYGPSIRGTRGGPYKPGPWGGSTRVGNKVYLHITQILEGGRLVLPALPATITRVRCITGGKADFKNANGQLILALSQQDKVDTIVELTLDADSMVIKPIETAPKHSLTDNAKGTSSSIAGMSNNASCLVHHAWESGTVKLQFGEPGYEQQQVELAKKPNPEKGFGWINNHLGHPYRYWQADDKDQAPWVELELVSEKTFTQVYLWENFGYNDEFAFDAMVGGEWKTLFTDKGGIGYYNRKLKNPVSANKVRVRSLKSTGPVSMNGIMLYE